MKKSMFVVMFLAALVFAVTPAMATAYKNDTRGTHDGGNGLGGPPQQQDGPGGYCMGGDCDIDPSFDFAKGDASQVTGISTKTPYFQTDDEDFVTNGAAAGGIQESSAEFCGWTKDGRTIGAALALGGGYGNAIGDYHTALAYGLVGNIAGAGMIGCGFHGAYRIDGSGEFGTVAVKRIGPASAAASSNGSFEYAAYGTGSGVVLGGGLTAGISYANVDGGAVSAVAGQVTISGVGNF